MGIFDNASEMFGNGLTQANDPKTRLLHAALGMLSNNSQSDGLHGLIGRFQEAGLGNIIGSWIGSDRNQPISSQQVQQVLGDGHLQQISEETGMPQEETASHLSDLLPGLIDKLTPDGKAPQGGLGDIGALLGQLTNRR